ncbi:MAG: MBL fold metallo-hydrolase [Acidobacteriota bacterium]|nr:MBL fold metallo-hydrolase [Acidobacteriota bacterium]
MKITVLGSGSTGNAVLICTEKTKILVDVGLSAKETLRRMALVGVDCADLDAILVTHEHSDHAGGLRVFLKSVDCQVFISEATENSYYSTLRGVQNIESEAVKRRDALKNRIEKIESSREFRIGDIDFEPFSVPHDAADNFGFIAKNKGVRVATLMDLGCMTTLIREKLRGCHAIVIESNHSRDMLKTCPLYSWDLKQRILSRTGHLSNEDLSDWLIEEYDGAAQHIVLAHLSQRANEPHLARLMAESALQMRPELFKCDTRITLSHHKEPTDWIEF